MGGNKDKEKEKRLAEQQAQDRALFLQSFNQAREPTPLQKAWEEANLNFINWEQGKDGALDVLKAPGLGPALSLYRHAAAGQQGERQGIGALRMGLNATDPALAAKMAEQNKLRREQEAAGQLENAVATRSAEAHGSVLPLSQLNTNRSLSLAGMAGNQAGQSQSLWAQFRPRPGFWGTLGQNFAGSLGSTLGHTLGGGNQRPGEGGYGGFF